MYIDHQLTIAILSQEGDTSSRDHVSVVHEIENVDRSIFCTLFFVNKNLFDILPISIHHHDVETDAICIHCVLYFLTELQKETNTVLLALS